MSNTSEKHYLLISLDALGDLTIRQPFFEGLIETGNRITLLVCAGMDVILPFLNKKICFITTNIVPANKIIPACIQEIDRLLTKINEISIDEVVCLTSHKTYLDEYLLFKLKNYTRWGFEPVEFQYHGLIVSQLDAQVEKIKIVDNSVKSIDFEHEIEKYQRLFQVLTASAYKFSLPKIYIDNNDVNEAQQILTAKNLQPEKYMLGCPGGIANITLKQYPKEKFLEAICSFKETYPYKILLVGIEAERDIIEWIVNAAKLKNIDIEYWVGTKDTFKHLLGLIKLSFFYFGNDTGVMHFAAALSKPVIVTMGGGHWPRFKPLANKSYVLTQKLPCFSCEWSCWIGEASCISKIDLKNIQNAFKWLFDEEEIANEVVDLGVEQSSIYLQDFTKGYNAVLALKNEHKYLKNDLIEKENFIQHSSQQTQALLKTLEERDKLLKQQNTWLTEKENYIQQLHKALSEKL